MSDHEDFEYAEYPEHFRELLRLLGKAQDDGECLRLLTKIVDSIVHIGMPCYDDEEVATEMLTAICAVLRARIEHRGVATQGLRVLCMLEDRNYAVDTSDELKLVLSVLMLHGLRDVGVQEMARTVLYRCGELGLPMYKCVSMNQQLDVARQFQALPASASKRELIVDCLHILLAQAEWERMSAEQIKLFKAPVLEFIAWCMQNFAPDRPENSYVGETACRVLFNLVAGCMQENDDRLLETSRCHLVNLNFGPLWKLFSVDPVTDKVDFKWLSERLDRPPPLSHKRGRAAGGSA